MRRSMPLNWENRFSGAKGIRTPDLLHAMQTRYQLRHSPATHRTPVQGRPARWNAVSIQAPRPCVVLDHHDVTADTTTTSPRLPPGIAGKGRRQTCEGSQDPASYPDPCDHREDPCEHRER